MVSELLWSWNLLKHTNNKENSAARRREEMETANRREERRRGRRRREEIEEEKVVPKERTINIHKPIHMPYLQEEGSKREGGDKRSSQKSMEIKDDAEKASLNGGITERRRTGTIGEPVTQSTEEDVEEKIHAKHNTGTGDTVNRRRRGGDLRMRTGDTVNRRRRGGDLRMRTGYTDNRRRRGGDLRMRTRLHR
ncbi:unnamed protein product [Microthlaspi erraticum]|uniref:Uncharacterized protein n=1 Tax=Microthlaspi erraticum TaxID=1685480 RepID=A0A6D2JVX2_9BRAS|nr:unnamed protein product [Microthlaspi erraticum]